MSNFLDDYVAAMNAQGVNTVFTKYGIQDQATGEQLVAVKNPAQYVTVTETFSKPNQPIVFSAPDGGESETVKMTSLINDRDTTAHYTELPFDVKVSGTITSVPASDDIQVYVTFNGASPVLVVAGVNGAWEYTGAVSTDVSPVAYSIRAGLIESGEFVEYATDNSNVYLQGAE